LPQSILNPFGMPVCAHVPGGLLRLSRAWTYLRRARRRTAQFGFATLRRRPAMREFRPLAAGSARDHDRGTVRRGVKDDYLPDAVTVGTLDGATLKETPLSATV
jgi:hypothetical protein